MFTSRQSDLDAAHQYRVDAEADGWACEPLYAREDVTRAARLTRDGFVMHVIARDNSSRGYKEKFETGVNIWGPDGLAVKPPRPYGGMDAVVDAASRCNNCGNTGGYERYSFAGRCCLACLPEMRKKHEQPGWDL